MIRAQTIIRSARTFGFRYSAAALAAFVLVAACTPIRAQQPEQRPAQPVQLPQRIITIVIADGKTGKTITPDNFVIRYNHLNAIRNETLALNDDGTGKLNIPANATHLSVQGTYHNSVDVYVNCDAAMEKDTSTLHWYSIDEIVKTGVSAPNECYKGKYAKGAAIPPIPGEFIFYVREIGWHDSLWN